MLVHRFQRPAPAAERILAALEEEGWPPRIDDPLLPRAGAEEPRRLRRELAALNRRWKRPLLRFYRRHGAGTLLEALLSGIPGPLGLKKEYLNPLDAPHEPGLSDWGRYRPGF